MSVLPRGVAILSATLALSVTAVVPPRPASAQNVRPWVPPRADSVLVWATEAKAAFQTNRGDSVGGANLFAYERVGRIGRRMLRTLGRGNFAQAQAMKTALDSLGLDTDVAVDPAQGSFALLMVRNPDRRAADAVGYLYWYRQEDLRMQGKVFHGGFRPSMRVWWTGMPDYPYEWAVVDEDGRTANDEPGALYFSLFRLTPTGSHWTLQQDEETLPVLGEPGEAQWADLNRDGRPELVSWTRSRTDSLFVECRDCPRLLTERVFVRGRDAFELHDERLLPSPYATFVRFVRLLLDRNTEAAKRLLEVPSRVTDAVALGFGTRRGPGTWTVEYAESGEPWPRWLAMRFRGPKGVRRYIVHFTMKGGHWVIRDWIEPKPVGPKPVVIPGSR